MRLDENEGAFTIPEFGKIQFEGFCRFIDQGLMEELYNFPKKCRTLNEEQSELHAQIFKNQQHSPPDTPQAAGPDTPK